MWGSLTETSRASREPKYTEQGSPCRLAFYRPYEICAREISQTQAYRKLTIDYEGIMRASAGRAGEDLIGWLTDELVYAAYDAYRAMTPRPTAAARITHGTFEYVYDDYASLEAQGLVSSCPTMEARLVLAIGRSAPRQPKRDDSRLRGVSFPQACMKPGRHSC